MPSTPEAQFALLAFSALFSVINPMSVRERAKCGVDARSRRHCPWRHAAARPRRKLLAVFAVAGGAIFTFFGITVPAFQIAGGLIFALLSIRTLQEGREEVPPGDADTDDPSIVPLGIPVIAGPGAISTVMILVGQAQDGVRRLALGGAIAVNILLTFLILLAAPAIVSWIGPTGQRIVSKIMGLITAVIGVQFVINGVTTVFIDILRTVRSTPGS